MNNQSPAINADYKFIESEEYEKGFAKYYADNIAPLAAKYEPQRENQRFKNIINILTAITVGLGGSFLLVKSSILHGAGRKAGQAVILPPLISWWFFVHKAKRKYFTGLKNEVIPLILKFIGDFQYKSNGEVPYFLMEIHCIRTLFKFEDIITYTKDDSLCTIFEQAFWDVYKYSSTIYLSLEYKKPFDVDLVIISKKINLYIESQDIGISSGLKKAQKKFLESRNFNLYPLPANDKFSQSFELYSNFSDTALINWLNDDIIDALITLDNVFEHKGITLSIKHKQILIILKNKQNSFEAATSYNECTFNASDTKRLLKELHFAIDTISFMEKIANKLPLIEKAA